MDYFELKNILVCRQVSKKCREIVDNFLYAKLYKEPFNNERFLRKMKRCPQFEEEICKNKYKRLICTYLFYDSSKLKRFIELMKRHCDLELSPFVGHAEVILANTDHYSISSKVYKCSKKVRNFIQLFGKYITRLEIKSKHMRCVNSKFSFGQTIQMCLEGCPNLRTFSVRMDPFEGRDIALKERICSFDNSLMFNGLSLPKNLISFYMNTYQECSPSLSDLIMNRLIQPFYNEKLLKLTIVWKEGLNLKMPQLRELTLCFPELSIMLQKSHTIFERIFSGEWLDAPIEKLRLKSSNSNSDLERYIYSTINYADVMKMLRMFPTIRYLKLDYPISSTTSFKNLEGFRSDNIHTLEIPNFYGDAKLPLHLLSAFPKLKYLRLCIAHNLNVDVRVVKSFRLLHSTPKLMNAKAISLYESELWKMADDLERVVLQGHIHRCGHQCRHTQTDTFNSCKSTDFCPITIIVGTREGYRQYCATSATDN